MKNLTKNVMIALVALALTIANTSCKKSEDPIPNNNNNNNNNNNTNTIEVTGGGTYKFTDTITFHINNAPTNSMFQVFENGVSIKDGNITSGKHSIPMSNIGVGTHNYSVKIIDGDKTYTYDLTVTVNNKTPEERIKELNGKTLTHDYDKVELIISGDKITIYNTSNTNFLMVNNTPLVGDCNYEIIGEQINFTHITSKTEKNNVEIRLNDDMIYIDGKDFTVR